MNKLYRIMAAGLFLTLYTGCDDVPQMLNFSGSGEKADTITRLKLSQPVFSPDYKTMVLDAWLGEGTGLLPLSDSSKVFVNVSEIQGGFSRDAQSMQPRLVKVENIAAQKMEEQKVKMLALVDLTLPQSEVDRERLAVEEVRNLFSKDNLYVAFIEGITVSETMPATDYLLGNYFVHVESNVKYLYRAILEKMEEMKADTTSWTAGARYTAMTVMSDGATYIDDLPMDPDYFQQEQMLAESKSPQPLYYANFSDATVDAMSGLDLLSDISDVGGDDVSVIHARCTASNGLYQEQFDWAAIEEKIEKTFGLDIADYRFTLENPDHKVYRGRYSRKLKVSCYNADTHALLAEGSCDYALGSVYSPIIVRPVSLYRVLAEGCFYALMLLLTVWLVLQIVVPYAEYKLFLRRHVLTYKGRQMSLGGGLTDESCYLCKTPFVAGDQIVTKCQHTMHLSCWDENQYQCPEYGRHCQAGRHYYNRKNLFDPQNATIYLRWIIVSILAGLAAWIAYTVLPHPSPPLFGLSIGFFLTLALSSLSVARRDWTTRLKDIGLRAIIGGIGGLLFFLLGEFISGLLRFSDNTFIIDWIPWALTSYWIARSITWGTRIRLRHALIIGVFLIGLASTYLWALLYGGSSFDYRVSLLTVFLLFAVAMAIGIANTAPRSERYFLSTSGIAKQMDIALYKWFKANPNETVTIGLSVDCRLQLSWDIQSTIAPIEAKILMQHGAPWLYAVEEGVTVRGRRLKPGKGVRLYHGRTFTIGKTDFTFIEKDK